MGLYVCNWHCKIPVGAVCLTDSDTSIWREGKDSSLWSVIDTDDLVTETYTGAEIARAYKMGIKFDNLRNIGEENVELEVLPMFRLNTMIEIPPMDMLIYVSKKDASHFVNAVYLDVYFGGRQYRFWSPNRRYFPQFCADAKDAFMMILSDNFGVEGMSDSTSCELVFSKRDYSVKVVPHMGKVFNLQSETCTKGSFISRLVLGTGGA